jgi:hypothetical protein
MTPDGADQGPVADDALVVALASGASYDQAAARAGVSPTTVDRRMRQRRSTGGCATLAFRDRLHRSAVKCLRVRPMSWPTPPAKPFDHVSQLHVSQLSPSQ